MRLIFNLFLILILISTTGCSFYEDYKEKEDAINAMKADKDNFYDIYIFGEFDSKVRFPKELQKKYLVTRMKDPFSADKDYLKLLDLKLNYPAILIFDDEGLILATEKQRDAINFLQN